jgi:hypothetical protein
MLLSEFTNRSICMSLAVVLALSGCATPGGPDRVALSGNAINSVEVAVGGFAPGGVSAADADPDKSAAKGALIGAAPGGALAGMAAASSVCATPWTAGICAMFLGVFGLMAVVGGTAGATQGASAGSTKEQAQHALAEVVRQAEVQNTFARQVADYGNSSTGRSFAFKPKDAPGPEAKLEVAIVKVDGIEVQGGSGASFPPITRCRWKPGPRSGAVLTAHSWKTGPTVTSLFPALPRNGPASRGGGWSA